MCQTGPEEGKREAGILCLAVAPQEVGNLSQEVGSLWKVTEVCLQFL